MAGRRADSRGLEEEHARASPHVRAGHVGALRSGPLDRARRPRMARLTVVADKAAMSAATAERFTSLIESAMASRGAAAVALTGGSTPDVLYGLLADPTRPWRARIDWQRLHLFWSDERQVPPDHPESNYGLAYRLLLQQVHIPE